MYVPLLNFEEYTLNLIPRRSLFTNPFRLKIRYLRVQEEYKVENNLSPLPRLRPNTFRNFKTVFV